MGKKESTLTKNKLDKKRDQRRENNSLSTNQAVRHAVERAKQRAAGRPRAGRRPQERGGKQPVHVILKDRAEHQKIFEQ